MAERRVNKMARALVVENRPAELDLLLTEMQLAGRRWRRINAATTGGASPLGFAARHGHVEVVNLLLKHGASPTAAAFSRGWLGPGCPPLDHHLGFADTPLRVAIRHRHAAVVEALIDALGIQIPDRVARCLRLRAQAAEGEKGAEAAHMGLLWTLRLLTPRLTLIAETCTPMGYLNL